MTQSAPFRDWWWHSAEGLRLHSRLYESAGAAAPTVLCLHGLTRNGRDFEALADHLSARYRVICPDLRGRGLSAWDPAWHNYHPGTYLADLAPLLDGLDVRRVAVIGTSLGGILAMLLPTVRPGVVAGMVLNDVGPEIDSVGAERIRGYAGRLPTVGNWSEAVAQLQTVFGAAWPGLSAEDWLRLARRSFHENANGVPVADVDGRVGDAMRASAASTPDLWPLYATLGDMPVLAIRGALSDILSDSVFARMRREKPDLVALTVANRGHAPLLDESECVDAIDRFLAGLRY